MKNFAEFVEKNRAKIYALAEKNTLRNQNGSTVISRDDPWFYEDEWDMASNAEQEDLCTR